MSNNFDLLSYLFLILSYINTLLKYKMQVPTYVGFLSFSVTLLWCIATQSSSDIFCYMYLGFDVHFYFDILFKQLFLLLTSITSTLILKLFLLFYHTRLCYLTSVNFYLTYLTYLILLFLPLPQFFFCLYSFLCLKFDILFQSL